MIVSGLRAIALLTAPLLAAGCYCPMLSGRYCDLAPGGPCSPPMLAPLNSAAPPHASHALAHGHHLHGTWASFRSRLRLHLPATGADGHQGPDYVSPQAKFHPVPTRPAFEPQLAYLPPELLEPGGKDPLPPAAVSKGP